MTTGQIAQSGKSRWQCRSRVDGRVVYCYSTTNPLGVATSRTGDLVETDDTPPKAPLRKLRKVRRYIITSAQNATPIHRKFFSTLVKAAEELDAELLVIPLRYKNPTSRWAGSQKNAEYWTSPVQPYLWDRRIKLNANLILLADIKTQPTASDPVSGFEGFTGGESGIIGHTKVQLKVVAAPSNKYPKIMTSTGACTVKNYTDSKAGKKGEFHHTLGAVIVEISGKKFHLRHINADNKTGEFIDLDKTYTSTGSRKGPRPEALIMGDTHVDFICPAVERATFGRDGIVQTLNPKTLVWHDLLDAYAVNPHHAGNPFNAFVKRQGARDDVAAEVGRAIEFLRRRTDSDRTSVVVSSNHDDFLRRWIVNTDWRSDPTNAEFYLETARAILKDAKLGGGGLQTVSPFAYHIGIANAPNIRVLRGDEPFTLARVELSMHGDRGPNGARGSIKNLRRIGLRSIIGHSHTPGIDEGCFQVGTSTRLRLEYNTGPSSWLNAHCVLHANGARQMIFIINGKWRI